MKRIGLALSLVLIASGCRDSDGERRWFGGGNDRVVAVSAGDAELDGSGRLNFEVTSDVYRRWTAAQAALGKSEITRYVAALGRRALTQEELDRAVGRVENDGRARAAIEGAGMTPLEYVYATVAIEQAMAVASGRLAPRQGGVTRQNVDIVGEHRDAILGGGVIGDTAVMVLPPEAPAVPAPLPTPLPPTPEPQPVPAPLPEPQPTPPVPTPTIPSEPTPQPRPDTPAPAPTIPTPNEPPTTIPADPTQPAGQVSPPPPSGPAPSRGGR